MTESVQIGPIRYAVTREPDPHCSQDGERLYGQIIFEDAQIRLRDGMAAPHELVTLWHETLHALLVQQGITKHNEALITGLAYGIVGVLRDNPAMRGGVE